MSSSGIPVRGQNILGLSLFFDSNLIGNDLLATRFLVHLHLEGCIAIRVSDMVATEQLKATDEMWERLSEESAQFAEAHGVGVFGHSRFGSSVWAGAADVALMDELRATIKPEIKDWSVAREQHVRDVMHVHTAVRYGAEGFVTLDKGILRRADAVAPHIKIWTPQRAAQAALKRLRNHRMRTRPWRGDGSPQDPR